MLSVLFLYATAVMCVSSEECKDSTFDGTVVGLKQHLSYSVQISGCLEPSKVFYDEKKFLYITIENQTIPVLKKNAITGFHGLMTLTMSNNYIDTVKEDAFLGLPQLLNAFLTGNGIRWVEVGVFCNKPNLTKVSLSGNKIELFQQNTFDNLPKLYDMNLSKNILSYFKQEWFNRVPQLSLLDLSYNLITFLPARAFTTLTELGALLLQNNRINIIHRQAFDGLRKLYLLNLEHNDISRTDFSLQLPKLALLKMSYNDITYLSNTTELRIFKDSTVLEELTLDYNKLEGIAKNAFSNLPSLWSLKLSHNRLKEFNSEWFENTSRIRDFDLSFNQIEVISGDVFNFNFLHDLKVLDLSYNRLKILDVDFTSLSSYNVILKFVCNNITYVSEKTLASLKSSGVTNTCVNLRLNPIQCSCLDEIVQSDYDNVTLTIRWESFNDSPVCIAPKNNQGKCIERGDEDFDASHYTQFHLECVKRPFTWCLFRD